MGAAMWGGVTCVMCSCLWSAMAQWGSSLCTTPKIQLPHGGSCILQQKREYGPRNEGGYGGGCYLNDLTLSGVGSSALKLCASVPLEKGSTSKIDSKVLVRLETPLFAFS